MIRLFLLPLLALGIAVGVLIFAPLAVVLDVSAFAAAGSTGRAANGTMLDGRLEGITANGTSYGDAAARLLPSISSAARCGSLSTGQDPAGAGRGR